MGRKRKTDGGVAVATTEKKTKRGESPEEIKRILEDVEKAEKEVQRAEIELNSRKEAAKSAKAEWMVAVEDLRRKVRTRERWREESKRQPLLNGKKPAEPPKLPEGAKTSKRIGILQDLVSGSGTVIAKKGDDMTGYLNDKGECFVLDADGKHFIVQPESYTEIVADEARPLLDSPAAGPRETPAAGSEAWKLHKLAVLKNKLSEKAFDALEATHIGTLGELQQKFNAHGQYWPKELGVHGRHKEAIETSFTDYVMAQQ